MVKPSTEVLDEIAEAAAALAPAARDRFIRPAIHRLSVEPPLGLNAARRIIRELAASASPPDDNDEDEAA